MTKTFALTLASATAIALAVPAAAAQLATTVSASSGAYSGDIASLNDGVIPPLGQFYAIDTVFNHSTQVTFTFDFGGLKTVTDVLASVDNNDDYRIDFYDGASLVTQFFIPAAFGSVPEVPGGMDIFASFAAGNGATQLGVSSLFQADRATIVSYGGDGFYGIGEVQFFNNGAVPEPASWAMMIGGFAIAGGAMRRARKTTVRFA